MVKIVEACGHTVQMRDWLANREYDIFMRALMKLNKNGVDPKDVTSLNEESLDILSNAQKKVMDTLILKIEKVTEEGVKNIPKEDNFTDLLPKKLGMKIEAYIMKLFVDMMPKDDVETKKKDQ